MPSLIDLTGQRFNSWVVLKKAPPRGKSGAFWVCKCDCGQVRTISSASLRRGESKSCGCNKSQYMSDAWLQIREENADAIRTNMIGRKFGRWTVESQADDYITKSGRKTVKVRYWNCVCDCGNKKAVSEQSLKHGESKSCGCYRDEILKATNEKKKKCGAKYQTFSDTPTVEDALKVIFPSKDSFDTESIENAIIELFPYYWKAKVRTEQSVIRRVEGKYHRKCELCGKDGKLDIHHKKPISDYGGNEKENIMWLCRKCHAEMNRGDKNES